MMFERNRIIAESNFNEVTPENLEDTHIESLEGYQLECLSVEEEEEKAEEEQRKGPMSSNQVEFAEKIIKHLEITKCPPKDSGTLQQSVVQC